MLSHEDARDMVGRMARVRVYSGALGFENEVMAEGNVMSYIDAPSIELLHDDGKLKSWSIRLRIEEVGADKPSTEREFLAAIVRGRTARRWSQERLAKEMTQRGTRMSQSEVSRIERGQQTLLITEAMALADLLEIELHVGGES